MTDEEYQQAYQAGYQDAKDDSRDLARRYALALFALCAIRHEVDEFIKEAIPHRPHP